MYQYSKKSVKISRKTQKCNNFANTITLKLTLMKQRILSAAIVLISFAAVAQAQMARLYTSESGLTNSLINDIYQDSKGFIWIATENGLARFDGMDFSTFRFDRNRQTSIASNLVLVTYEDSRGTTWVGTSAGLQTFDSDINCFTDVSLEDGINPSSDRHISGLLEIEFNGKDFLLASSSGRGIYILELDSHKINHLMQERINASIPSLYVSHMFLDMEQNLWVCAEDGGIEIINIETGEKRMDIWAPELAAKGTGVIVNTIQDCGSKVIIGTFNQGILIYDKDKGRIRRSKGKNARDCRVMSMLKNNIIAHDSDKTFLTGLENNGLKLFNAEDETLSDIHMPHVPYHTDSWKVHSLMEDNQGNVWVGAFQTGVMVLPKSMYGFDYMNFSHNKSLSDNSSCVTSVIEDEKTGNLWIGTDGGGIFQLNPNGNQRNFTESNSSLSNNSIMSLALDSRGTLWIATYLGGLMKYTENDGFRTFGDSALNTNKTVALAYSRNDELLYVGTHGGGLAIIDLKSEKVIRTLTEDVNKWISTLYLDSTGMLWVGTYNGPMCYDHKVRKLIHYDIDESMSTRVHSFCEASDGRMWIGTGEGLVCFDRPTKQITSYSENDGLPSNVIADIQESIDGHMWISTQNGLSRLTPSTGEFKNYYQYDGLQENEFHARASHKASDGKLYFGGIKGLTSFYPHIVDQRTHPVPPLYFSNLTVMNKIVEYDPLIGTDNILDKHITEATQITLPYDENIFSIEFSVLEYTNPHKITYSYIVEGFDNGWNQVRQGVRTATYTNLPAGRYTLKVKAYFDGEPNTSSYKEIGIRILPPWYGRWWAFICYAALAGFMVLGMLKWRDKQRSIKKDREESNIKELKLKMFTNISHEIRTPLTLVMSPLKKLREAEKDPKLKELYNLMYRNSLRILRLVNQLLDMRKIDNGQMQLHFLETDVVYFIKDIMQSFDNLAVSKKINFTLQAGNEITNLWIDQGNFDKIIFNIISNAFKFTPEGGDISIHISSPVANRGILQENVKEFIEFTIENSGSEVEERHLERLFDRFFQVNIHDANEGSGVGLNLAKMLVDLHHGDIRAYNTEKGMAFSVRIPTGCSHLSAQEMTKPTNHKDLYTKNEDLHSSREDVTEVPQHIDEDSRLTKSKRTLILVDDDDEMRAYLKHELQGTYNVESFANAKDAWATISTTIPDAVVTDLVMDGMNGAELCSKIKKNPGTNHIPVLILTSSGDEQNIQRCVDSGADRFFTKPISLEILKGAIANAISTRDTIRNKFSKEIDYGYSELDMPGSGNNLIDKVIRIIRANMDNPDFGVEELSREIGMSRVHLNRKLKEIMNISPSNLIKSIRLKQAAFLLINHKVNISEVAYRVGFSTHSYFSNSFHDYFGMTPKEFVAKYMDCKDEETLKKIFD